MHEAMYYKKDVLILHYFTECQMGKDFKLKAVTTLAMAA